MYKWLNTVLCIFAVTPHAGVRIEIILSVMFSIWPPSPPTRGCELKLNGLNGCHKSVRVTPHAGVRIEIINSFLAL